MAHKPQAEIGFQELRYGLYQTVNEDVAASDSAGTKDTVSYKYIGIVDTIPAEIDTSFGIEYKITSTQSKDVKIKRVWVFPRPMKDKRGKIYESWSSKFSVSVNEPHITYYKFTKRYELLKGKWILHIYHGDKLLHKRVFYVK